MSELSKKPVETVRRMPADQNGIARTMFNAASDGPPENIDPSHLPDIIESLAQMRRGEFATDAEVAASFRQFGS